LTHATNFAWGWEGKKDRDYVYLGMDSSMIVAWAGVLLALASIGWQMFTHFQKRKDEKLEKAEAQKKEITIIFEVYPIYFLKNFPEKYIPTRGIPLPQQGNTLSIIVINKFAPVIINKILLVKNSSGKEEVIADLSNFNLEIKTINSISTQIYNFDFSKTSSYLNDFFSDNGFFEIYESGGKKFRFPHENKYVPREDGFFRLNDKK
jgi:hypothetical protein